MTTIRITRKMSPLYADQPNDRRRRNETVRLGTMLTKHGLSLSLITRTSLGYFRNRCFHCRFMTIDCNSATNRTTDRRTGYQNIASRPESDEALTQPVLPMVADWPPFPPLNVLLTKNYKALTDDQRGRRFVYIFYVSHSTTTASHNY